VGGRIRNAVKLAARRVRVFPLSLLILFRHAAQVTASFFSSLSLSYIKLAKWLQRGEEHNGIFICIEMRVSLLLPRPRVVLPRATSASFFSKCKCYIKMLTFDSGWRLQTHTHWGDSRYLHLCCGTAMQRETSFHCKIMTLDSLPHTKWSTECDLSHMAFARTAQYMFFFYKMCRNITL